MRIKVDTPYHLCFETLSSELRMNILNSLKSSPKSVNELASELNIERSTVSHALSMLKLCSIVDMKKKGKNNVYSLHDKSMLNMKGDVLEVLDKHMKQFCGSCKKVEIRS